MTPKTKTEFDRSVLVLLLEGGPTQPELRGALGGGGEHLNIRIVAPAHVGLLQWYTTDEDSAHVEAAERAHDAERLVDETNVDADVEAAAGEADPTLAVEDALEDFPADEIVIVGGGGNGALEASLRRFGIPVRRLGPPVPPRMGDQVRETGRAVMSGRSSATPYAVITVVMLSLLAVACLILVTALLVLWLI
jgi:hypothetical protein